MTREDVIRIAKEVGFDDGEIKTCQLMFEHFAFLVAQQEREACAMYLERGVDLGGLAGHPGWQKYTADLLAGCAAVIRARGQQ